MAVVSCTNVLELTEGNIIIYDIYVSPVTVLSWCQLQSQDNGTGSRRYFSCHGSPECTRRSFYIPLSFCIFTFYRILGDTTLCPQDSKLAWQKTENKSECWVFFNAVTGDINPPWHRQRQEFRKWIQTVNSCKTKSPKILNK